MEREARPTHEAEYTWGSSVTTNDMEKESFNLRMAVTMKEIS